MLGLAKQVGKDQIISHRRPVDACNGECSFLPPLEACSHSSSDGDVGAHGQRLKDVESSMDVEQGAALGQLPSFKSFDRNSLICIDRYSNPGGD
jgi:hypothetical protein